MKRLRHWVLQIDVPPRAQPRPRSKTGQKAYYPKRYTEWRQHAASTLAAAWDSAQGGTIKGPIELCIYLTPKTITIYIDTTNTSYRGPLKGDIDNYSKAILDILQEIREGLKLKEGILVLERQVLDKLNQKLGE